MTSNTTPNAKECSPLLATSIECLRKIMMAGFVITMLVALAGYVIENRTEIWRIASWVVTLGGSFWGGAAMAFLGVGLAKWASSVLAKLPNEAVRAANLFAWLMITGACMWLLACLSGLLPK